MSTGDDRFKGTNSSSAPASATPQYAGSVPNASYNTDIGIRSTKCVTGLKFLTSMYGIINIVIIVAIICVLISAGVSSRDDCQYADTNYFFSSVRLSAFHTRNAIITFAIFGLVLMLIDTILYVTSLITRLPKNFEFIFIIVMFVMAGIYFILGCCAAAWQKKMTDVIGDSEQRKGAAGAASFFLFVAMLGIIVDFVLRLVRPAIPVDVVA